MIYMLHNEPRRWIPSKLNTRYLHGLFRGSYPLLTRYVTLASSYRSLYQAECKHLIIAKQRYIIYSITLSFIRSSLPSSTPSKARTQCLGVFPSSSQIKHIARTTRGSTFHPTKRALHKAAFHRLACLADVLAMMPHFRFLHITGCTSASSLVQESCRSSQ